MAGGYHCKSSTLVMSVFKIAFLAFALFVHSNFMDAQVGVNFAPMPESFGISSNNPVYSLDIPYGNIDPERQSYHLFLPDTAEAHALVIYIHGGGFTGGNKDVVLSNPSRIDDIKYFLDRGIAYASVGYRLLETTTDTDGVIKCLSDSKRALQHIRHYATELHIAPERIVLTGSSAGAGTSLWLGTKSDMADSTSADPISRQSTRVCAVHTSGSQATYDLYKWETEVYHNFDNEGTSFTLDSLVDILGFERASNFYGGFDSTYQIIHDDELIQYRQDVDMLYHMSADDPPLYLENRSGAIHPNQDLFHHSLHGVVIEETAMNAGLPEVKAIVPARGIDTSEGESKNDFLIRHLEGCVQTTSLQNAIDERNLRIYPNPTDGQFIITIEGQDLIETIKIFSISGSLVLRKHQLLTERAVLANHKLLPGLYIVQVTGLTGTTSTSKLVVR